MLHTSFYLLRQGGPCQRAYRALSCHLGGIHEYGLTKPIPYSVGLENLDKFDIDDVIWALPHCEESELDRMYNLAGRLVTETLEHFTAARGGSFDLTPNLARARDCIVNGEAQSPVALKLYADLTGDAADFHNRFKDTPIYRRAMWVTNFAQFTLAHGVVPANPELIVCKADDCLALAEFAFGGDSDAGPRWFVARLLHLLDEV